MCGLFFDHLLTHNPFGLHKYRLHIRLINSECESFCKSQFRHYWAGRRRLDLQTVHWNWSKWGALCSWLRSRLFQNMARNGVGLLQQSTSDQLRILQRNKGKLFGRRFLWSNRKSLAHFSNKYEWKVCVWKKDGSADDWSVTSNKNDQKVSFISQTLFIYNFSCKYNLREKLEWVSGDRSLIFYQRLNSWLQKRR